MTRPATVLAKVRIPIGCLFLLIAMAFGTACRPAAERTDVEVSRDEVASTVAQNAVAPTGSDDSRGDDEHGSGKQGIADDTADDTASDAAGDTKGDAADDAIVDVAEDTTAESPAEAGEDEDTPDEPIADDPTDEIPEPGALIGENPPPPDSEVDEPAMEMPPVRGLIAIHPEQKVWIDKVENRVVMDGHIGLTRGQLELLVSKDKMKSHESVISVLADPSTVHAALLAVGAIQGEPVSYGPEVYRPAKGGVIEILVRWWDLDGTMHETRGQDFVRNVQTRKALAHDFIFTGSFLWKDERTGKTIYVADSAGDFICVSNFPSAMIDLSIDSTANDAGRFYEAFTENIPPRETRVRVFLTPTDEIKGGDPTPLPTRQKQPASKADGADAGRNAPPDSPPTDLPAK